MVPVHAPQDGIEAQAIDRTNRIGQTKPVHVYQLIAENTVESKVISLASRYFDAYYCIQVLEIQNRKKKLIQEAGYVFVRHLGTDALPGLLGNEAHRNTATTEGSEAAR